MNWLDYDGYRILYRGQVWILRTSSYIARYPYRRSVLTVDLYMEDQNCQEYTETRSKLGDHWSLDVLGCDVEVQCDIINALQKPLSHTEPTILGETYATII